MQLCSIKGGKVPIDEGSLSDNFQTDDTRKFLVGVTRIAIAPRSFATAQTSIQSVHSVAA